MDRNATDKTAMDRTAMDRIEKFKIVIFSWLMVLLFITATFAIAEPSSEQQTLTQTKTVATDSAQSTSSSSQAAIPSDSITDGVRTLFPQLERALVIVTIINLVIIIFAVLLYLAKRKMSQFSPARLTGIKQEHL